MNDKAAVHREAVGVGDLQVVDVLLAYVDDFSDFRRRYWYRALQRRCWQTTVRLFLSGVVNVWLQIGQTISRRGRSVANGTPSLRAFAQSQHRPEQ